MQHRQLFKGDFQFILSVGVTTRWDIFFLGKQEQKKIYIYSQWFSQPPYLMYFSMYLSQKSAASGPPWPSNTAK